MNTSEKQIEYQLITVLQRVNYVYRDDIRDMDSLAAKIRNKFHTFIRVYLTDVEFTRQLGKNLQLRICSLLLNACVNETLSSVRTVHHCNIHCRNLKNYYKGY